MIDISNTISKIEKELKKPLPGFESQKQMSPKFRLDNFPADSVSARNGAVLLLLYPDKANLCLVFIQRAVDGGVHSGQISFPGGKQDDTDKDLIQTSLRETYEEVGVEAKKVKVIGKLTTLFIPVSNYNVLPVIAYSNEKPKFKLNPDEVAGLIELPVNHFLDSRNNVIGNVEVRGELLEVPFYKAGKHKIWGATAMIMSEFIQVLMNANGELLT